MRTMRIVTAVSALLAAAFGCDLLSSATTFAVDTEWQNYTIDSAGLGLTVPSGATVPAVPCSAGAGDICAQAAQVKCGGGSYSCKVQCSTAAKCEILASAEIASGIDLSQKIGNKTQAAALEKVSLQRVVYNTDENTLNFDTPQLEIFVGPSSAKKTSDPGVVLFGTMPAIGKGSKPNDIVTPSAGGTEALTGFVKNYKTPFTLLAKASLRFASGDAIPQGKLAIKVKAYFEVDPLK